MWFDGGADGSRRIKMCLRRWGRLLPGLIGWSCFQWQSGRCTRLGAAVYLSSFLLAGIVGPPAVYLWLSIVTGVALVVTEGMRHRALYREVAGLATLIKLVLLGIAYHGYLPQAAMVALAFFIAAIAAHLPKNLRHRLVF